MRALVLGSLLLLGLGPLAGDTANEQCTYQFPASRTMLASETRTFTGYRGAVLAPGNVLSVSFESIPVPEHGVNLSGVSLFVIPTFHVSSSALLEVAVAQSTAHSGADAGTDMAGLPSNASDLESRGTMSGYSIFNAPSTEPRDVWQPCRYYEVGDILEDIQRAISNDASEKRSSTTVEVLLRHHSGDVVFVEGNSDIYVNNVVLQIYGDCDWDMSEGSASAAASSSPSLDSRAYTYWDYTTGSAGDQGSGGDQDPSTASYYGGAPGGDDANGGPIRNGRRHTLCGGEYLDDCDLGPYIPSDVGDGSCQWHLNTEGCHYDGGDCCSVTCGWATTSDTPYACQGAELDPYYCGDPEYAIDVESALHSEYSAASKAPPFLASLWRHPVGSYAVHGGLARGGSWNVAAAFGGQMLVSLVAALIMGFAG